jgi:ACS family glucarate transporter-like MFS transporter/ACS family D-galactonate transporter-like MFS transporter
VLLEALESRVAPGWNWRLTFLLFGVPGLVWAAWFWKWFRDEPAEHPSVSEAELSFITDGQSTNRSVLPATCRQGKGGTCQQDAGSTSPDAHGPGRLPTPWLALFSSPALWWICGQQMCRAAGYMFFTSWFATYLQETRGVSIAHSGFLNMLPLLAVVIGGMLGGALSDWLLERTGSRDLARRWMGTVCLLACAALIFWALMLEDALAAVLVISAGSFFSALAAPCAYTLTIDMGGSHVATVNATMNMMGNLGAWAFPIAVPWLLVRFGSWDAVLVVFGALYVVGAGFWLLLKPEGTVFEQALINRAAADVDERT